jgi:DNA-directed RNA polymerase specialized sigma24 family protein
MNKTPFNESSNLDNDMLLEYHFDYQKAKPNRFAAQSGKKMTVVVLDEDVAQVFTTPESVNKALKTLIEIVPRMSLEVGNLQNVSRSQEKSEQTQNSYSFEEKRKQHPHAYERWSKDEEEQLRSQYTEGTSIDEIATKLQRKPSAVKSRLKKLNLL